MDELNRKMLEFAEFHHVKSGTAYYYEWDKWTFDWWEAPNGVKYPTAPDFTHDLNACEKWIWPKLRKAINVEDISFGEDYCHILWWTGEPKTDSYGCGVYAGEGEPAMAFCLAVEKLMEAKK